ncbi:MAG: ribonuclease HII [Selenomonadaceae bacterium]|nr:ribonuclease HII [Selenomonadaceae bacterium]
MNPQNLTIKEIVYLLQKDAVTEEFLTACASDRRDTVPLLAERWRRKKRDEARVAALYAFEDEAFREGFQLVAGVDEAGRGPLAGPVAAAAVILPRGLYLPRLNDSKKLTAGARKTLFKAIKANALAMAVKLVDAAEIDRINIAAATRQAMYAAISALNPQPDKVLIDAFPLNNLAVPFRAIVRGDTQSASIAAASIVAKVTRDGIMEEYDRKYPEYGFAKHKGYGTLAHLAAIKKYGPSPIHRLTFAPLRQESPQ